VNFRLGDLEILQPQLLCLVPVVYPINLQDDQVLERALEPNADRPRIRAEQHLAQGLEPLRKVGQREDLHLALHAVGGGDLSDLDQFLGQITHPCGWR
jgi:hypothetical protein